MKKTLTTPTLEWLSDPRVFGVNRLPAHSDHIYYETLEEAKSGVSMSMRYELNGNWKFHYAVNPASRPAEFYQLDFDCSNWSDISVPGHIQLQGYGTPQYVNVMYPWDGHCDVHPPEVPMDYNPVGSYIKIFNLPKSMKDKPVYISFQGVESAFYVWLNGQFVGYSEDSFTPAEFELTPFIKDGENKLAVEVYQYSTGSWLEDQDFWRFSGIFRDVYLYTVPDIHVYDLHVRAELDSSYTRGMLTATLPFCLRYLPALGLSLNCMMRKATLSPKKTESFMAKRGHFPLRSMNRNYGARRNRICISYIFRFLTSLANW